MARRLRLAARVSKGAPPALFALLQRDRSPWKRQVLVDLCRLRDTMRDKLGTMPLPPVEPEAWESMCKGSSTFLETTGACVRTESGAMGVSVCSNPDMEFWCLNCPVDAKTWANRAALRSHMMSKHGWRNPWRQYAAGSCCPVCRTQFHSRARAVDHLAHRTERCRQAIQEEPDRFLKTQCRKSWMNRINRSAERQ